jgi:hypothetical protein
LRALRRDAHRFSHCRLRLFLAIRRAQFALN